MERQVKKAGGELRDPFGGFTYIVRADDKKARAIRELPFAGWAPLPQSKNYFYMGGTSMATPLSADAVALVREYLRTKQSIAKPSAALIKATFIAGTDRLPGMQPASAVVDNNLVNNLNLILTAAERSGAGCNPAHRHDS